VVRSGLKINVRCLKLDELLRRANHLPKTDQLLIEMAHVDRLPITKIAQQLELNPQRLRRSIKRLYRRLNSRLFCFVIDHGNLLPEEVLDVAEHFILNGMPMRNTATWCNLSLHQVRCHVETIKELYRCHRLKQR